MINYSPLTFATEAGQQDEFKIVFLSTPLSKTTMRFCFFISPSPP